MKDLNIIYVDRTLLILNKHKMTVLCHFILHLQEIFIYRLSMHIILQHTFVFPCCRCIFFFSICIIWNDNRLIEYSVNSQNVGKSLDMWDMG